LIPLGKLKRLLFIALLVVFACEDENDGLKCDPVTDIDGNEYQTVQIGNQCWMAENLKTTHYRDGSEIPGGYSDSEWTFCD